MCPRVLPFAFLVAVSGGLFESSSVVAQQSSQVEQWYRWEAQLTTQRDYHLGSGNPYRDLNIGVTFTPISCSSSPWCRSFTGLAFWDGGRTFRIRSAFPQGTWKWEIGCYGVTNGLDCGTDPALNTFLGGVQTAAWGTVNVVNQTSGPYDLLERGFVQMEPKGRYLTYGDGVTKFFWQGDTAWTAVITDRANNTRWLQFLADRKQRRFSVVLLAPAPSGDDPTLATTILFEDIGTSCLGAAWPKSCSRWRVVTPTQQNPFPDYWKQLDEKIRLANENGFLVVLVGLMDPQGNAPGQTKYPRPEDAAVFARNLVARLSGSHVIFSPSFDDQLSLTEALMDAVGEAIRRASPRHLVTAHLAGGSQVSAYNTVADKEWHCLHVFQSGHAFTPSNSCPAGPTSQYPCAVFRARTLPDLIYDHLVPLTMELASCPGVPVPQPDPVAIPNANGEAAYDGTYTNSPAQAIDTPHGVRHTGYYSTLNGAFGFTLGVLGIWDWSNVSAAALGSDGSKYMAILGDQFRQQPWQALQKRSTLIKNQPSREDQKIVMAVTADNNFAMLYLPDNSEARIDASSFLGFDCNSTTWTKTWVNPRTGLPPDVGNPTCQNLTVTNGGDPTHALGRPACTSAAEGEKGNCDWLVILRKTGFSAPRTLADSLNASPAPEVFPKPRDDGRGWEIATTLRQPAQQVRRSVSSSFPLQEKILKLPTAARLADGSALIVWQAEDLDGDLDGIFAQRLGQDGTLLGPELRINTTTRFAQVHPSVAATPSGGAVVAWSSYAQDGELGGIFMRLFINRSLSSEVQVNETTIGHQDFPKVAVSGQGSFVVAWVSDQFDGLGSSIYARRFSSEGKPLGREILVKEATAQGYHYLTDLSAEPSGGFTVTWSSYGPMEEPLGIFSRRYDASALPSSDETLVVAVAP